MNSLQPKGMTDYFERSNGFLNGEGGTHLAQELADDLEGQKGQDDVEQETHSSDMNGGAAGGGILDRRDVDEEDDDGEEFGQFTAAQIKVDQNSQYTPSAPSINEHATERAPSPFLSPQTNASPYKRPPYLHPSVSRLRSHFRQPSSSSITSVPPEPHTRLGPSPIPRPGFNHTRSPSMFSDASRRSSYYQPLGAAGGSTTPTKMGKRPESYLSGGGTSDIYPVGEGNGIHGGEILDDGARMGEGETSKLLPAFRWQTLRKASEILFESSSSKRNGSSSQGNGSPIRSAFGRSTNQTLENKEWGEPTCMVTNGIIAIGTSCGWTVVFSLNQEIKHVLGLASISKDAGAVTTIAISPDQTYVAVGHEQGYLYIYDLANPSKPARTAPPLALQSLLSGRKEGHLIGTKIVTIDFVGKRHTAIVSGDVSGRAFWWSLGKVMGVESNDVVRLLGNLPRVPQVGDGRQEGEADGNSSRPESLNGRERIESPKKGAQKGICSTASLFLGTKPHFSDTYSLMSILTPSKLVIVGLQPTPRTWYRKLRKREAAASAEGSGYGCAAWLTAGASDNKDTVPESASSPPMLAFSWGRTIQVLSVREERDDQHNGYSVESGPIPNPSFHEAGRFTAEEDILSIHWYNPKHLLLRTAAELFLLDARTMRPVEMSSLPGKSRRASEVLALSAYKGRLFLLISGKLGLGSLSSWADRILALCQTGDYLDAIELATAYYLGSAPGNTIGLPEDSQSRKAVLHDRLLDLMRSSLDYAFAEERMTDGAYHTAGFSGVDLTPLFENLASTCFAACSAMEDMTFAYEDVYERYAQSGIEKLYLERLERFIYEDQIRDIPPNLVQGLLERHYSAGEYQQAEDLIWMVDPASLDVNQAIRICQQQNLLDALIYVHNRCLRDFVSPLIYVARLMQQVTQHREEGPQMVGDSNRGMTSQSINGDIDKSAYETYKLYNYIEKALCGLSYPDGRTLPDDLALQARQDMYGYLFNGKRFQSVTSSTESMTGKDALSIIFRYDPEAFLHALDLAFEDTYLNDHSPHQQVSRQGIVDTLLDLVRGFAFRQGDITFLYIFISRNLPKYPQFLILPPTEIRFILDGLAKDEDQSTVEDRELAAEFLLSRHIPEDPVTLYTLFDKAGFFRILESVYRRQARWPELVDVLVRDPQATNSIFGLLEEVFLASNGTTSHPNTRVVQAVEKALSALLQMSIPQTAVLLDRNAPKLHEASLLALEDQPIKQIVYFRSLLEPALFVDDQDQATTTANTSLPPKMQASIHITENQKLAYLDLLRQHESDSLIDSLSAQSSDFYPLDKVLALVETLPRVSAWVLDKMGKPLEALSLVADTVNLEGMRLIGEGTSSDLKKQGNKGAGAGPGAGIEGGMTSIQQIIAMGVSICQSRSLDPTSPVDLLRELWLTLLESEVRLVRNINGTWINEATSSSEDDQQRERLVGFVRTLIKDTFTSLISSSSAHSVPFPSLFKRLVESARSDDGDHGTVDRISDDQDTTKDSPPKSSGPGTAYAEFRVILTSMLSSYSGERESLRLASKIFGLDLHELMSRYLEDQRKGWKAGRGKCGKCEMEWVIKEKKGKELIRFGMGLDRDEVEDEWVVNADGRMEHVLCPVVELIV